MATNNSVSTHYCNSNSCCSFSILKVKLKSKGKLFAIAFKSDNYFYCDSWKSNNYLKGNKAKRLYWKHY